MAIGSELFKMVVPSSLVRINIFYDSERFFITFLVVSAKGFPLKMILYLIIASFILMYGSFHKVALITESQNNLCSSMTI